MGYLSLMRLRGGLLLLRALRSLGFVLEVAALPERGDAALMYPARVAWRHSPHY
jgi:hypothetical protein